MWRIEKCEQCEKPMTDRLLLVTACIAAPDGNIAVVAPAFFKVCSLPCLIGHAQRLTKLETN